MIMPSEDLRILVIEENPKEYALIEGYLGKAFNGSIICGVGSITEAETVLTGDTDIDVVVLDESGYEGDSAERINKISEVIGSSPLIILEDRASDDDYPIKFSSNCHITDYLPKRELTPFVLKKSIFHCLGQRSANRSLSESEREYRELFDINPVPMFVYDLGSYRFLNVNQAAVKTYGYSKEEFLSMTIKDIRPAKDLPELEKILKEQNVNDELSYRGTFRHTRKNGEIIHVQIQSKFIIAEGQQAKLVLANDVTEKLKAQEALKFNEQRFRSLVQGGSDMITIMDSETRYKYVSPTSETVLGIPPDTLIGKKVLDYIHEDDKEQVVEQAAELSDKKRIQLSPYRYLDAKGNWRWLETILTNMLDDPIINGIVTNSRDITQKMEQELKLKESIKRYEILSQATSDVIWDLDIPNDSVRYNFVIHEMFGYQESEIGQKSKWWSDRLHPEDRQKVTRSISKAFEENIQRLQVEYRFRCVDGSYKYIYDRIFLMKDDEGNPLRMIGAMQDMTELLEKKKELEKANDRLKAAQKIAKLGYWTHDFSENYSYWSEEAYKMWERSPETFKPNFENMLATVHPVDKKIFSRDLNKAFPNQDFKDLEHRIITPSGHVKWILERLTLYRDKKGVPKMLEGIVQDITEKKGRELKLKETISRYEILSRATSDTIWDLDIQNDVIQYNYAIQDMFGYKQEHIENTRVWWESRLHPDDHQKVIGRLEEAFDEGIQRFQLEYRFRCANGRYKYIYDRMFLVRDDDGTPVRLIGAMQDMTELLTKKKELLKAYEQLKTAQKIARLGSWTYDLTGNKLRWSEETYRIWDMDPQSFTPNFEDILAKVHPDDKERFLKTRDNGVRDGNNRDIEFRIITETGQIKWLMTRITFHRGDSAKSVLLEGISQDITEYKKQEEEIRSSLKEKETLLAEIHHRVKNNLAVASSLMQLQAFREDDRKLNRKLMDSVSRIKTMAMIHEQLYQSNSFVNLDFCKNLKKLVLSIIDTMQCEVPITPRFQCTPIQLNINQAIPCALITNEVVTNILKHAFKSKKAGNIRLYLSENDKRITLKIEDNGVGLPHEFDITRSDSLGVHLIDTLSQQLDAEYHYDSLQGKGTHFTLRFERE